MSALFQWVERRTGTTYPRTILWVTCSALAAVAASIIEALP